MILLKLHIYYTTLQLIIYFPIIGVVGDGCLVS